MSLLAGADFWRTVPIPRLGIPALKVSDGPAGARGGGALVGSTHTAAFPVGIALGSTWNVDLLREVGAALAREAHDKGAGVLLAPTINLFRSTLNGRNFESYAEDPFLTGTLATAYVQGLQAAGVAATVKHFVGNESEYQRNTISSDIPERALRELYLRPFEMVVKDAQPWAIMTAYNKLDGTYASEHPRLLEGILRGEWKFDGLVMSDWGGTHSAGASVRAGLDLEMPGPSRARTTLLSEAEHDPATRAAVRQSARNVLRLIERTGTFADPRDVSDSAEKGEEAPDIRALIRRAGAEGIVLLKNDGLLPLPQGLRVAVIGPNAATGQVMGGGSAQMNAHRRVSPLEGLRAALGEERVTYALGCDNDRFLPTLSVPVQLEFFDAQGVSCGTQERAGSEQMLFSLPQGLNADDFRATMTLTLQAEHDGEYDLSLYSAGLSRLRVDGQEAIDNWTHWQPGDTYFNFGSDEVRATHFLKAGPHTAVVEFAPKSVENTVAAFSAMRLGFRPPTPQNQLEEAVSAAAQADVVVLCVGTNGDWETEGVDRWGLELPGRQNELIGAVLAANPRTVVLLQTGGPVTMPWLDAAPAVLQAWFPGQEAGFSVTDVLLGQADPGGRLPQTFPRSLHDDPVHPLEPGLQYPGEQGHVAYQEGLFIGYRHVDRHALTPLFPFGHGLSYTTFTLTDAQLSAEVLEPGGTLRVRVQVRNTGERSGQTVVQLYVREKNPQRERPDKELKGFAKMNLKAGETQEVQLELEMRSLAAFDDTRAAWVADAGEFEVLLGQSSADLPITLHFRLLEQWSEGVSSSPKEAHA
ncbi:glycoside hydrolase family 3 C-terminal domain-containing protein (plasmid) [Deinococcus sp. KNUC1210]|uniref:beta-glucosidase n=1 Tax=Deinococcus sp. KNUC1210 TaxID=2917691 RepID=UPI001EF0F775|nr:glycoside hydrolase family 3 C-terminal domain-containing protein [Deinococcus sp. KNUC1210]ULH17220.1 glycoside hydrolase family 3 C-terminal domain-containing protein [Deinococcus sp. KNUC1210]